ncbi:hypothetical protein VTL71DRAFT_3226 [Oculimacula yallundae]|uniref:Uncharacterized protein n=1 Tax=Oculimacula yallundae TaxID=86028 RepID=A0ABR4C7Q1_9HELO
MQFLRILLIILFHSLFALTIAQENKTALSQQASVVTHSLYPPDYVQTPDIWTPSTRRTKPVLTPAPVARSLYPPGDVQTPDIWTPSTRRAKPSFNSNPFLNARSLYPPSDVQTPDVWTYSTRRAKPGFCSKLAPIARSLSPPGDLKTTGLWAASTLKSSPTFTFTPPFASQTLVSIYLPACLPHDPTLTPLGCREPSAGSSFSNTRNSAPIPTNPPSQATDFVWKTFVITVTRKETISQPCSRDPKSTGLQTNHRPLVGEAGKEQAGEQVLGREVITVISLLNSNGVPTTMTIMTTETAGGSMTQYHQVNKFQPPPRLQTLDLSKPHLGKVPVLDRLRAHGSYWLSVTLALACMQVQSRLEWPR